MPRHKRQKCSSRPEKGFFWRRKGKGNKGYCHVVSHVLCLAPEQPRLQHELPASSPSAQTRGAPAPRSFLGEVPPICDLKSLTGGRDFTGCCSTAEAARRRTGEVALGGQIRAEQPHVGFPHGAGMEKSLSALPLPNRARSSFSPPKAAFSCLCTP